ncbi:MAG TPA: LamG domain-containing protein, partial [Polyangia bacterium]
MVLNGTSQYARISRTTGLEPSAVTVSIWVKRNGSQTQWGKVLTKTYNDNGSEPRASYALQMNSSGADSGLITFHTGHAGATQNSLSSTAAAIADNTWTHVVATYDPAASAPQKKIYLNGVLNASGTVSTALMYDTTSTGDLYLGGGGGQYFKGSLDDVRIFNRVLSASDVAHLYQGGHRTTPLGTQTLNAALTADGDIVIAAGTLDASASACSAASCNITAAGSWVNLGGTFTPRTGTVTLSGTGTSNLLMSDRNSFNNLSFSSTGTWTLRDRLDLGGTLTMSGNGTLALGSHGVRAGTVTKTTGTISGTASLVLDAESNQTLTLNSCAVPVRIESPLDDGLVGYWKLDDGRGTSVTDHSGNGSHGTVVNNALWTNDASSTVPIDDAGALVFDGSTQYVNIGTPAVLNFSGQITMAAWVKVTATDGFRNVLDHGDSDSPSRDTFLRIVDGYYRVGTWYSPTDTYAQYAVPGADVGAWVHLVGVNDGSTWRLYRNGTQVATQAGSAGAYTATANWRIGAQGASATRFFSGRIDDVRIYNRGLSANEVAALHAYGYTGGSTVKYSLAANATMASTFKIDSGIL